MCENSGGGHNPGRILRGKYEASWLSTCVDSLLIADGAHPDLNRRPEHVGRFAFQMRGYTLLADRVFSQGRSVLCRQPHPLSHRIRVEARTLMSEEEHKTERSRQKKIDLINGVNSDWRDLYDEL